MHIKAWFPNDASITYKKTKCFVCSFQPADLNFIGGSLYVSVIQVVDFVTFRKP